MDGKQHMRRKKDNWLKECAKMTFLGGKISHFLGQKIVFFGKNCLLEVMGETEAFVEEKIFLLGYTLGQWPLQLTASQPHNPSSQSYFPPNVSPQSP